MSQALQRVDELRLRRILEDAARRRPFYVFLRYWWRPSPMGLALTLVQVFLAGALGAVVGFAAAASGW